MAAGTKIIDRYLGRQVLVATLLGVGVLSLVLVFGNLFKEVFELLVDKNLPLASVLKFMAYILPFSLIFTIPWGFLTAVLLVYGRLSADNELVSFRMAGMSMPRICRPVFVIAAGLVALSFWINTTIAPRAQAEMKAAMYDMAIDDPMALFAPDRVIDDFPGYSIYAEERDGDRLKNIEIYTLDEKRNPIRRVQAASASILYDADTDQLRLTLDDATAIDKEFRKDPVTRKTEVVIRPGISAAQAPISLDLSPLRESGRKLRPSTLDTGDLRARLADPDSTLKSRQKRMIKTEINKRYSFSLACITFALIGIPLGVTAQRRETSVGFAISMVIAVVYFLFIIIADTMKDKTAAQYLMWLPNIVFVGIGLWLFIRLSKR